VRAGRGVAYEGEEGGGAEVEAGQKEEEGGGGAEEAAGQKEEERGGGAEEEAGQRRQGRRAHSRAPFSLRRHAVWRNTIGHTAAWGVVHSRVSHRRRGARGSETAWPRAAISAQEQLPKPNF
jgi:hypothetical protein